MFARSGRSPARWGSSSLPTSLLALAMRSALWFRIALRERPGWALRRHAGCRPAQPQLLLPEAAKAIVATAYETPARAPRVRSRLSQSRRWLSRTREVRGRAGAASASPLGIKTDGHLAMPVGTTYDAIRYGPPDGVRRAGFDTAGFVVVGLAVAVAVTCGIADTPFR